MPVTEGWVDVYHWTGQPLLRLLRNLRPEMHVQLGCNLHADNSPNLLVNVAFVGPLLVMRAQVCRLVGHNVMGHIFLHRNCNCNCIAKLWALRDSSGSSTCFPMTLQHQTCQCSETRAHIQILSRHPSSVVTYCLTESSNDEVPTKRIRSRSTGLELHP